MDRGSNAFPSILVPENFIGIVDRLSPTTSNPDRTKVAFDGAHGFGNSLWREDMLDYQKAILGLPQDFEFDVDSNGRTIIPDNERNFGPDARSNGTLLANNTADAFQNGTTAHGNQSRSVDEIHWSSNTSQRESFAQKNLNTLNDAVANERMKLLRGEIDQATFNENVETHRDTAQKKHIAFTKFMQFQYLEQGILDNYAADFGEQRHIAINKNDPSFADSSKSDAAIRQEITDHNTRNLDFFDNAENNKLYQRIFDEVNVADFKGDATKGIDADKELNARLVEIIPDYARLVPEIPTPDSVRANILARQKFAQANSLNTKELIERINGDSKAEFDALEKQVLDDLRDPKIYGEGSRKPVTLEDYQDNLDGLIKQAGLKLCLFLFA